MWRERPPKRPLETGAGPGDIFSMLVLGLDTAFSSCSAAVLRDGAPLSSRTLTLEKGHAEHLAPLVAEVLKEAGVTVKELDRVGVVIGPGGFAGVRVGVAFARGLAIGTRLIAVGVTSLEALARSIPPRRDRIAAVMNAYRGEVYAALYGRAETLIAPFVAAPDEACRRLLAAGADAAVGDGVSVIDPQAEHFADFSAPPIDAAAVARLAALAPEPSSPPAPLYLRNPDAKPASPSAFAALLLKEGEH